MVKTSPFESSITLKLEEDISSTPKLADRQSESRPSFNAERPDRASTSIPRHRSPSIVRGKIHRKRSSPATHGSSGTESSDSSDDTYTGRSPTPVRGGPRKKSKRSRSCRGDHTTSQRGDKGPKPEGAGRPRNLHSIEQKREIRRGIRARMEEKKPTQAVAMTNTLVHIKLHTSMSSQ